MGGCLSTEDPRGSLIPRNKSVDCSILRKSNVPFIFIIGGPGSGKISHGKRIASKYGYRLIVPSDLLRSEVYSGSDRGELIKKIMKDGRSVPPDVVVQLVEQRMIDSFAPSGFLVVGFPRDKIQAKMFLKDIREPCIVLYLKMRKSSLEDRMRDRAAMRNRFDDTPEAVDYRIKEFLNNIGDVVSIFRKFTVKIHADLNREEVFKACCNAIESMLRQK